MKRDQATEGKGKPSCPGSSGVIRPPIESESKTRISAQGEQSRHRGGKRHGRREGASRTKRGSKAEGEGDKRLPNDRKVKKGGEYNPNSKNPPEPVRGKGRTGSDTIGTGERRHNTPSGGPRGKVSKENDHAKYGNDL